MTSPKRQWKLQMRYLRNGRWDQWWTLSSYATEAAAQAAAKTEAEIHRGLASREYRVAHKDDPK